MGFFEWLMILAAQAPVLIFWIAVLIFAIVMLRRGGGRAERFFIAGASVKILGTLLGVLRFGIALWIIPGRPIPADDIVTIVSGYDLFIRVIGMAGLLLLFYAFWLKYKETKTSDNHVENL
jgi:hypothetical protein